MSSAYFHLFQIVTNIKPISLVLDISWNETKTKENKNKIERASQNSTNIQISLFVYP